MKKILLILIIFISCYQSALCTQITTNTVNNTQTAPITSIKPISMADSAASPVQPQAVDFVVCTKFYKIDCQKLFYLTLAGINANRFSISEIKSLTGYVVFTAAQNQFLAMIIKVDDQNSMLKIIPCNNTYYFPVGIVQNMFKYVELNINLPIEKLSIL